MLTDHPDGGNWQTHWVPSTVFYFESEGTLREFVLQRRRWLNGTTAGYLYLLRQRELWFGLLRLRRVPWAVFALVRALRAHANRRAVRGPLHAPSLLRPPARPPDCSPRCSFSCSASSFSCPACVAAGGRRAGGHRAR